VFGFGVKIGNFWAEKSTKNADTSEQKSKFSKIFFIRFHTST